MYDFTLRPRYTPQWWQDKKSKAEGDLVHPSDLMEEGVLNEDSWILHFCDPTCPCGSEAYMIFPTIVDLLLWMRFLALPYVMTPGEADSKAASIIRDIDDAEPSADVAELAVRAIGVFNGAQDSYLFDPLQTAHDWLSEGGAVEEFRMHFDDPAIACNNGMWTMSAATWRDIEEEVSDTGMTGHVCLDD